MYSAATNNPNYGLCSGRTVYELGKAALLCWAALAWWLAMAAQLQVHTFLGAAQSLGLESLRSTATILDAIGW